MSSILVNVVMEWVHMQFGFGMCLVIFEFLKGPQRVV